MPGIKDEVLFDLMTFSIYVLVWSSTIKTTAVTVAVAWVVAATSHLYKKIMLLPLLQ